MYYLIYKSIITFPLSIIAVFNLDNASSINNNEPTKIKTSFIDD